MLVSVLLCTVLSAHAIDYEWKGVLSTAWEESLNWLPPAPSGGPGSGDTVEFSAPINTDVLLTGSHTIVSVDFPNAPFSLRLEGDISATALILSSGNLTADGILAGISHSLQNVTLGADGVWDIGSIPASPVEVEVRGVLSGPRLDKEGNSTLLLTGGTDEFPSSLEMLRPLEGDVIIDGARLNLTSTGKNASSASALSADGGDITLRNGADVQLATNGSATAFIENATLTVTGSGTSLTGGELRVAAFANDTGSMIVEDSASVSLAQGLDVGRLGDGDLIIRSNACVSFEGISFVGSFSSGTGRVLVEDSGMYQAYDQVIIGQDGDGVLIVTNGGSAVFAKAAFAGSKTGGTGTITVSGSGSTLSTATGIALGGDSIASGGIGELIVNNGGEVQSPILFFSSGSSVTVDGGKLTILDIESQHGALGTINISDPVGGSAFIASNSTLSSFPGVIQDVSGGTGSLTKEGDDKLILTGTNTYTGGTTINEGELQIGDGGTSGSILGDVTNSASLTFYRSSAATFAGAISGSGDLTKRGSGMLTLTGTGTYTGGTTISGGELQLGDGGTNGSIAGDVAVSSGASLIFNRSNSLTYGEVISGSGALTKTGNGTLTLTGDSTHTGGTTISGGILRIGDAGATGSIEGNVLNNATLRIARTSNMTFDGIMSGSGNLLKSSTGALFLTEANTYSGGTTISDGRLLANNTTGSATGSGSVQIGLSGTLGGTGSVAGAITMHVNGIIAPGESAGSLTASSNVTLTGTYQCEIDGANADKLAVGGAFDISAGILDIDVLGGGATQAVYVIATYSSLTGASFATVTDLPAGYEVNYAYNGNQIVLILTSSYEFWSDSFGLSDTNAFFDADPDGDGGKNGYEWATGTNPTNPASITPLEIGRTNADTIVSFTRNTNATDVVIYLQRSLDLTTNAWNGVVTNTAGSWNPPGLVGETGAGNPLDVEVTDVLTNQPAANYRLLVE